MARQTDRFYESIRKSHKIISFIEVISPDQEVIVLPAVDGSVDVDRTASIRRKISVDCIDPSGLLTPRNNGEVLTPYGTHIRAYRGIEYAPGDREICPLGVFRLSKSSISDSNGGSPEISIEGFDLSRGIARDKFITPYTIDTSVNAMDALKQIVDRTYSEVLYDAITSSVTTVSPLLFEAGDDPWEAIQELATSMGCEVYFNAEGRLAILPPPDINALPSPDFTYIEGEDCTMVSLSREYTDDNVFNGVVVTGEAVGDDLPPVRGEAWDENPVSPTYRLGPYGEVPTFVTDKLAKTEEEAEMIARSTLSDILGESAKLSITGIVNPSYEGNDIVRVRRVRSGVDGLYAIDTFNVPLREGTQTLTMRELRPTP